MAITTLNKQTLTAVRCFDTLYIMLNYWNPNGTYNGFKVIQEIKCIGY